MSLANFIDNIFITVRSGNGGAGSVSFRREKYVPKGGPDGGDGGRGGNIIFIAKKNLASFNHFYSKRLFVAGNGEDGMNKKKFGKDGKDIIITVPIGTIIKDNEKNILKSFEKNNEEILFLKGGIGGKGNCHFVTSTNQTPQYSQSGKEGEECSLILELKIIADIGLVGLPNSGKSTLLSTITNAKPKIGNYPFTTLTPSLGIFNIDSDSSIAIADIPGIIKGAHKGLGLGIQFLRHIERTKHLLFVIDSFILDSENKTCFDIFLQLRNELKSYSDQLYRKDYTIGISKIDLIDQNKILEIKNSFPKHLHEKLLFFSCSTNEGLEKFKKLASKI